MSAYVPGVAKIEPQANGTRGGLSDDPNRKLTRDQNPTARRIRG